MASDRSFATSSMSDDVIVAIKGVDIDSQTAVGWSPSTNNITIGFGIMTSGIYVIPQIGEQWVVTRTGRSTWALSYMLPANDDRPNDRPAEGLTSLGRRGPTRLYGETVEVYGQLLINGAPYTGSSGGGGSTTPAETNPASLAWDTEMVLNSGALVNGYNDLGGGVQVNAVNGVVLEAVSFRLGGDPSATIGGTGGISIQFYQGTPTSAETKLLLTIAGVSAHDQIAALSPTILIPHNAILRAKITLNSATCSAPVHIQWRGRRV